MKEKKQAKPKKPKEEKKPSTRAPRKTKKKEQTTEQETNIPEQATTIPQPAPVSLPTIEEVEDIKEEILRHGLINPYALILYNYMRVSTYETNIQVVLTFRETMMKIDKIHQFILNDLDEDTPPQQ